MPNNVSISKYLVTNKTNKTIVFSDLSGSPYVEPKKTRDLLVTNTTVEIEKSKSLTYAIKQNKVSVRTVDNTKQVSVPSNILLQDDLQDFKSQNTKLKTANQSINFSSQSSRQITIPSQGINKRILRIFWYISSDPGSNFFQQPQLSFFVNPNFKDNNIIWKASVDLIYTEVNASVSSGSTNVPLDDPSDFEIDDLIHFQNTKEFRRIETVSVSSVDLISPTENNYVLGDGVARVAEAGGFDLYDTSNSNQDNIYIKAEFDSAQTVNTQIKIYYV